MSQRLFVNRITSVGAVEEADNEPSKIMFWKRRKNTEPAPGRVEKKGDSMPFDVESLSDDAKLHVQGLEAKIAELTEEPAPLPVDLPEPVTKRLDELSETIEKDKVEKDRIAKELADLKEEMATEKYEARAATLQNLLGKPEDVAPVLKALATANPEAFTKLDTMFDTLIVKDVMAPLMAEIGDTSSGGTADDQISVFATEIRKNSPDLSAAEARMQAWVEHPDLRVQAREEGN